METAGTSGPLDEMFENLKAHGITKEVAYYLVSLERRVRTIEGTTGTVGGEVADSNEPASSK